MRIIVVIILMLLTALVHGQTHTFPGNNVFPSTSTVDFASGSTVDFTGATVTGLSGGVAWGGITGTLSAQTDLQTALDAKQAADADLTAWAAKTTYAGSLTITTGKTFNVTNNLTLSGTDGSTLAIGGGGTLGTAAYTASSAYEVPITFSTGLTRSTNTVTVNTSQNIAKLSNLTSNGFVKTGSADGTLSVDTATYQASDADLTTWAGITPVAAVGTWIATPSSANLRSALTDENGTGVALFNAATTPDFTTGITIGAAAATGKILIGDGAKYAASTPTWPTTAGAVGYTVRSDNTNFAAYPQDIINSSVSSQSPSTSEVYVAGSNVVVTAGDMKAKGQYRCVFDIVKSAGTGIPVVAVKIGTAGTTSDTTQLTFTFPGAGTSVADTGTIEVIANWRTVGGGSSAVVSGVCRAQKNNITAAGLWGTTTAALTIVSTVSGGFNSSAVTTMGVTFNGGTAFAGTITTVQATLMQ